MADSEHYTAQICLNGHIITDIYEKHADSTPYCTKCGAGTITKCPECGTEIRGDVRNSSIITFRTIPLPKYCHQCGKPYPWTQGAFEAAIQLAAEDDGITEDDIALLEESLPDIAEETPKTKLASVRVKKILAKAGKTVGDAMRDIVVDIASETAKKAIFGE